MVLYPLMAPTRASPIPLLHVSMQSSLEWFRLHLRVTGSWLNESVSWLYAARLLSSLNHAKRNAVLDGSSSIEELDLGVDLTLDTQALWDSVQANQRSVSNELSNRLSCTWENRRLRNDRHIEIYYGKAVTMRGF